MLSLKRGEEIPSLQSLYSASIPSPPHPIYPTSLVLGHCVHTYTLAPGILQQSLLYLHTMSMLPSLLAFSLCNVMQLVRKEGGVTEKKKKTCLDGLMMGRGSVMSYTPRHAFRLRKKEKTLTSVGMVGDRGWRGTLLMSLVGSMKRKEKKAKKRSALFSLSPHLY